MFKHKIVRKPGLLYGMLVFLFIAITVYFLARSVFIIYAKYLPAEKALAVLFLISEMFVMFQAFGYFGNVFRLSRSKNIFLEPPLLKDFPPVAILVASRHEPKAILEGTLICLYNLKYRVKNIYLLDDSSQEQYKKEAEELALKYGCKLFRRQHRHGAKAGIINDCLKGLTEKYVAIFDVDQDPISGFLDKIIPILESDQGLAFV